MHSDTIIRTIYDPTMPSSSNGFIPLEGLCNHQYLQFRLRLFLQILFEKRLQNNYEESLPLYEEFLLELETAWTTQLIAHWKSFFSKDPAEDLTNRFCKLLAKYTLRQIKELKDGKEYILQLGWTMHSICVTFIRKSNELHIRIDNLGEGCNLYHIFYEDPFHSGKKFVCPKLLAILDFNNLPSTLEDYLSSIIDNFANPKWDHEYSTNPDINAFLMSRVYEPGEKFPTINTSAPSSISDRPYTNQIVGNCTFASFSIGVSERLGQELCMNIVEAEAALLSRMNQIYRSKPSQFYSVLCPIQRLWFDSYEEFPIFLARTLEHHYAGIVSAFHFPYVMIPTIQSISPFSREHPTLDSLLENYDPRANRSLQIRINGSAGVGKTIFSQNLYRSLVSKHTEAKMFDFIFNIRLRNLSKETIYPPTKSNYSVIEIIEQEIFLPALKRKLCPFERILLQSIIDNKNILWVLDGLDELQHDLPHLQKAIQDMTVAKTGNNVIITSRPDIHHPYINDLYRFQRFNIEKYAEIEMTQFIDKYFADHFDPNLSVNKINQALQFNQQLKDLCNVPIILSKICQSVKEGNDQILTTKNLVELYNHLIFTSCRNAFKRQFIGIMREDSEIKLDDILKRRNIIHFYRTALKFTGLLAFTSLKTQRQVICTKEIVNKSFHRFGMNQQPDQQSVIQSLHDIGLFKPDENGGEFTHAMFQEFFAALHLIKLLNKPSGIEDAQAFIKSHKGHFNYHNVFAAVIHQLCDKIIKTEKEIKKIRLTEMIEQFLSNFVHPITDTGIQQIVPLINVCGRYPEAYSISIGAFPDSCITFLESIFQHILEKKLNLDSEVLWENSSRETLNTFLSFLAENPLLRAQIEFNKRLIKGMVDRSNSQVGSSSSSSSTLPENTNVVINALKCIDVSQSLDKPTIEAFIPIAESHQMNYSVIREMTALVLKHVMRVVSKQQLSDQDVEVLEAVEPFLKNLFEKLTLPWQGNLETGVTTKRQRNTSSKPNHSVISHQLSSLLPELYAAQSKHPNISMIYDQCRTSLINLTKQMLELPSAAWADYWNGMHTLDSTILAWGDVLTDESTHKLKDYISSVYNDAYGSNPSLHQTTRTKADPKVLFKRLGKLLMRTLNLFDLFDHEYGHMIINKLCIITNYYPTNHNLNGSEKYREIAMNALAQYRPNLMANSEKQLERLEAIYPRLDTNQKNQIFIYLRDLCVNPLFQSHTSTETMQFLNSKIRGLPSIVAYIIGYVGKKPTPAGLIEKRYASTSTSNSSSSISSLRGTPKRHRSS